MMNFHVIVGVMILTVCVATLQGAEQPREWVSRHLDEIVAIYRHFHAHPELSYQEEKTAMRLAEEWRDLGAEVTTGVGGHGVVALLRGGNGPIVMLRTDMDALPVPEKTGLVYASTVTGKNEKGANVGVMHACGHDIHMANLVGVARYFADNQQRWRGTLMLIGQPAEERGAGAAAMLDDGLFDRFSKPDYALALHVDAMLATGKVRYRIGYSLANVDSVDITVKGQGGTAPTRTQPLIRSPRRLNWSYPCRRSSVARSSRLSRRSSR